MRLIQLLTLIAAAALLIAGSYLVTSLRSATAEPITSQAAVPLDRSAAAAGQKTTDELIAFWNGRYQRDPRDYISLTYLAAAHVAKARETGSAGSYERADAALAQALELNPDYDLALATLSTVRLAQHDFTAALDLAERVYRAEPRAVQALATIGDAHLELGQYDAAAAAYATLQSKIDGPAVAARVARLHWIQGDAAAAVDTMAAAVAAAETAGIHGESGAWYHAQLGELYFHTGRLDEAAAAYEAALAHFDPYYLALAGLGKVAAARGDAATAVTYYQQVVTLNPQPAYLAQLGTLYRLQGDETAAQAQFDAIDLIADLEAQSGVLHNRQLVIAYADQEHRLAQALRMAEQEIAARADVYSYDALAWALYKNGRFSEAAAASEKALALGTPDAAFYYHAGMIQAALNRPDRAAALLQTALSLNPYFDVQQASIAQNKLAELAAAGAN